MDSGQLRSSRNRAWTERSSRSGATVLATPYSSLTETLTFLFTDIEGSTALLSRLGDDTYAEVLAVHHRFVRAGIAAHNGREMGTQGDGFFAVFPSPSACVAAVIETQRALLAHRWPAGEQVRVRMGIHFGEVSETASGLVGLEVNRAARVAAVAHGGQILLSLSAAALVRDSLPPGAALRDLGLHRLKDLGRPEQIFQLEAEGLEVNHPPLRSLDNPELPNNLPWYLSAFVGRKSELEEVRTLIESSRLVTLTGVGGSGKTRLALHVAAELLDGSGEGVWFVDLAPIAEPERVSGAVAAALGIREQAGRLPLEMLLEVIGDQSVLIVLDNCEHVVDACAELAERVDRSCRGAHLVATSREALGIDGEQVYRVRPLSLPAEGADTVADLEDSDAVKLFVERAQGRDSTFALADSIAALVARICRSLDGIPFAIELAAARLASMSLVHLNERLDQRFKLLTGGSRNAPPRQRTLQATFDWSFDLLSGLEQAVLLRLSVFVGGFELEAAEAVCWSHAVESFEVADLLGSLVNKSLVVTERSSGSLRYGLLETVRQYAAELLASTTDQAEVLQARRAHAEFYLQLSETAAPDLAGPGQGHWMKRLDLEWDNIRAALDYVAADGDRTEEVLRFGVALWLFFVTRGHLDPIATLRAAIERAERVLPALRARALYVTGYLVACLQGGELIAEVPTATELFERALDLARDLEDQGLIAYALSGLCWMARWKGDLGRATVLGEQAVQIARSVGDPRITCEALSGLADIACFADVTPTPEWGLKLRHEALAFARRAGDTQSILRELMFLGTSEYADGRLDAARGHYEEAIAATEDIGFSSDLTALWGNLGVVLLLQGELEGAALMCRRSLITARRLGRRGSAAWAIFVLACCETSRGDCRRAAQLIGAHDRLEAAYVSTAGDRAYRWTEMELRLREDNLARLREVLGKEDFDFNYAVGSALSFDEAFDLVLGRARSF